MSGRQLAREFRQRGISTPSGGGGGFAVIMIGLVALSFAGVTSYRMLTRPAIPVVADNNVPADRAQMVWTSADENSCLGAVANAKQDEEMRAVTENVPTAAVGTAGIAAQIVCYAAKKPLRLCDEGYRRSLVVLVEKYSTQLDDIAKSMNTSVAALTRTGDGENADVLTVQGGIQAAAREITPIHVSVTESLRGLAERGLISANDFGIMLGVGVPPTVGAMFQGAYVVRPACA